MAHASHVDPALLEAVIRDLPGGVLTTDPQGTVVHANEAAARILGAPSVEALVGRALSAVDPALRAMLQTVDKAEVELASPTGTAARVVGFSSRPVTRGGAALGMVISFSDITADKARLELRSHQHRLADLGKVVASVAHEIRNPVFAISSLAQVLRDENAITADEELTEMVDKIQAEAYRVSRLLEDLLAFGRERPLAPRLVDLPRELGELVADLGEVVTRAERDVPVPVSLRIGAGLRAAPQVWIDPDALRQVVVNLVRNARRAVALRSGQTGGGVTVSVEREGALVLRVDDDGIGMEADVLPRVFDAFFSRDPKGTGLGLAVVRRLLDQLAASIELASEPGTGTRVTVRIPVPEKPPRMPPRGP